MTTKITAIRSRPALPACSCWIALAALVLASGTVAQTDCLEGRGNAAMSSSSAAGLFLIDPNATVVVQRPTRLSWMRCAIGQHWDGTSCSGSAELLDWQQALALANSADHGGHDDWRLPDRNELQSIIEAQCFSPAINNQVFPATPSLPFWSSSARAGTVPGQVWQVDFASGAVAPAERVSTAAVRLVRGGT